jgi:long-chain acyl-CoA synthetase
MTRDTTLSTLTDLFFVSMAHDKPDCLQNKRDGRFQPLSSSELRRRVQSLAVGLGELGVKRGDRVALMAENGLHWPTVDFAALCTGSVMVPIYPTLLPDDPDQTLYITNDCGAKVLFVEGRERLDVLLQRRAELASVEHLVLIEEGAQPGDGFSTLDDLLSRDPGDDQAFEAAARQAKPDDLATFIYTSGTTNNPKGVMLTHGNITSNVVDGLRCIDLTPGHVALSFLPLSHSFERTVDYMYFFRGVSIAYAESILEVGRNMQEVRPHYFVSVPRVYEKVQAKIFDGVAQGPALRRKIFGWAVKVGANTLPHRLAQTTPSGLDGLKLKIADKLVFGKIRERLGNRLEFAISGGAPLGKELAEFFWGAGIPIFEGYGLTETSPVLTVNTPDHVRMGTVGPAIPNVELRIAEDGEILARGPNIMRGYFNNEAATAEAIQNGWFHTGDIGVIDADGFLTITDRKKELIVNAYGKNVPPAKVEEALKSSRFIGQAVALGDKRKFIAALLVPNFDALRSWATSQGLSGSDAQLIEQNAVRELFAREVEGANERLAHYEEVRTWTLLPEEFSIEGGELTPTQKVKRRIVNTKYADVIDTMYSEADRRRG